MQNAVVYCSEVALARLVSLQPTIVGVEFIETGACVFNIFQDVTASLRNGEVGWNSKNI